MVFFFETGCFYLIIRHRACFFTGLQKFVRRENRTRQFELSPSVIYEIWYKRVLLQITLGMNIFCR